MLESSRSDNVADYRLAAVGREADEDERLSLLEQLFDPTTRRRRALVRPGWRCLEVGAGRGSMAVWLAEQVGPSGTWSRPTSTPSTSSSAMRQPRRRCAEGPTGRGGGR